MDSRTKLIGFSFDEESTRMSPGLFGVPTNAVAVVSGLVGLIDDGATFAMALPSKSVTFFGMPERATTNHASVKAATGRLEAYGGVSGPISSYAIGKT